MTPPVRFPRNTGPKSIEHGQQKRKSVPLFPCVGGVMTPPYGFVYLGKANKKSLPLKNQGWDTKYSTVPPWLLCAQSHSLTR